MNSENLTILVFGGLPRKHAKQNPIVCRTVRGLSRQSVEQLYPTDDGDRTPHRLKPSYAGVVASGNPNVTGFFTFLSFFSRRLWTTACSIFLKILSRLPFGGALDVVMGRGESDTFERLNGHQGAVCRRRPPDHEE